MEREVSSRISKSRFINYLQCPKKLWLDTYHPELADEMDQTVFKNGSMVGQLAQDLFPGGTLVEFNSENPNNIKNMIKQTQELINSGQDIIYEAAFSHNDLLAICDIIVKVSDSVNNCYDIYEVKSSTELKDVYVYDLAFQQHVLTLCGIKVRNAYLVHINNQYERQGPLNIEKLFTIEKVTDQAQNLQTEISDTLPHVFDLLEMKEEYQCDIGPHCSNPYACQYETYCWNHIPQMSVFDISGLRSKKKFECYNNGIVSFKDLVTNDIKLSEKQQVQVDAELNGIEIINKPAIQAFLSSLSYPLYFLDFETFMTPVPPFDGIKPYQQIPSQYSLHYICHENGELNHKEFLAKEGKDPRFNLAQRLVEDIPSHACILAYNMSFEKGVIENLATQFPELCDQLMVIYDNILDLMEPFRAKAYYKKEMQGSYSIKAVFPALFPNNPELSYDKLGLIHDGSQAMNAYASLMELPKEERALVRQSLLEYCKLDTLAMVRIWEKLKRIGENIQ